MPELPKAIKDYRKEKKEEAKFKQGIRKGLDRGIKVLEFLEDPKKFTSKAIENQTERTKRSGAALLKSIKRRMMKGIPGNRNKSY